MKNIWVSPPLREAPLTITVGNKVKGESRMAGFLGLGKTTNGTSTAPVTQGEIQDQLYGNYQKSADWRDKIAKQATLKTLNMADPEMQITGPTTTNTQTGIGTVGLVAAVLAAALGPTALALWQNKTPAAPVANPPAITQPITPIVPPVTTPVIPPVMPPAAIVPDVQIIQQESQPDGTWKELWKLNGKRNPDGTVTGVDGRTWKLGTDGMTWVQQ